MFGRATCANLMGVNHEKNDQFYVGWGLYVSRERLPTDRNRVSETPSPSISKLIGIAFWPTLLSLRSLDLQSWTDGLPSTAPKGSRLVLGIMHWQSPPFLFRLGVLLQPDWPLTTSMLLTIPITYGLLRFFLQQQNPLAERCAVSVAHAANLLASCHYRGFGQSITLPLG